MELLAALLQPTTDATVDGRQPSGNRGRRRARPELLRDEVARRAKMSIAAGYAGCVPTGGGAAGRGLGREPAGGVGVGALTGVRRPVATPLNQRLGPHRRFHWATCDLAAFKEVKNQLGGTVNDVVLSVVSGAVRAFFERRGFAADGMDFRAAVPVNIRAEARTACRMGNRVSAWLVSLPIHERRPTRRLLAVQDMSRHLKDTNQAVGARVLTQTAEWTSTNVLTLGALLSEPRAAVQPDRHQCSRSAIPALSARRTHGGDLSAGPALREPERSASPSSATTASCSGASTVIGTRSRTSTRSCRTSRARSVNWGGRRSAPAGVRPRRCGRAARCSLRA